MESICAQRTAPYLGVCSLEHLISLGWKAQLQSEFLEAKANTLSPARIVAIDRDSVLVAQSISDLSNPRRVSLSGRLRHLGCEELAVGDWVGIHETRIDYLYKRYSVFVRKRAGRSSKVQAIAANVDTTLIVMSLNEDFSPRRAERYIVAAWDAGTTPVLVLTKADLVADTSPYIAQLSEQSVGCELLILSVVSGEGIDALSKLLLPGQSAVLVGSSGVGKSSLVNALLGAEVQSVASIREGDAKGKHTTTRRELLYLPQSGALLIDTPGMREFGLVASEAGDAVDQSFTDVETLAEDCVYRDCMHIQEPGCAVQRSIEAGELSAARLKSYQKLLREIEYNERRGSVDKEREARRVWKKRTAMYKQRTKFSPKS